MPLVPGPRRKPDSHLYRAVLVAEDGRAVIAGVSFSPDGLREVIERNRESYAQVLVERAEMPQDLQWERHN